MLLSHSENQFIHPTLLVRADHRHAELWFAKDLDLNAISQVACPDLPYHDRTSGSMNANHSSTTNSTGEVKHDEAEREYIVSLGKAIADQVAEHNIAYVWLVMVPELLHRVREKLSPELQKKITHCLAKDLIQDHAETVVERVRNEGTPTGS